MTILLSRKFEEGGEDLNYTEKTQNLESLLKANDPEQLLSLLKVWSFKPHYSEKNALLIFSQLHRPAVSLGSKKYWESIGFDIKPGEKPVVIWVPVKSEEPNKETAFEFKNRYDVTQTTGSIQYMFRLEDVLKSILRYQRISVRSDKNSPEFVKEEHSNGRVMIINPTLSNNVLTDLVPIIAGKMILESHAKESIKAASAMLIYRTTGNDEYLRQQIFSEQITKATIIRDRAAYRAIYDHFDKWFPGLEKIPEKTIEQEPVIEDTLPIGE